MRITFNNRNTCLALLLTGSMLLLSGCVTAKQKMLDQGMKPLDKVAYEELFSKPFKASYYSLKRSKTMFLEYYPEGKQIINTGSFSDEGQWRIASGEHCSKWNEIRNGAESCSTWFKVGEGKYDVFDAGGMKTGTLTVK